MSDVQNVEEENTSSPASQDSWADAQEAFEEPTLDQPEVKPSHLEQQPQTTEVKEVVQDALQLLKVPQKYKDRVKEYAETQVKAERTKAEEVANQARELAEGVRAAFQEIAANPQKLSELVSQYGQAFGLSPEVISRFGQQAQPQPQSEQKQVPQVSEEQFAQIEQKMLSTQDPREFLGLMKARDELRETALFNKFGQLFKLYHERFVAPNSQTLQQFRTEAEQRQAVERFESTKNNWNSALSNVKATFKEQGIELDKYMPALKSALKEDPDFSVIKQRLNEAPQDLEGRVRLIQKVAEFVTMKDRMEALKSPKPKFAGLPPNSKHINTQKTGGGGWDDPAHQEIWS